MSNNVKAWSETVMIPTYGIGEPNRNPMFLEKRVYQGSSGVIYPHPVIDRVDHEKSDQPWTAVFLENDWIKLMILPALGGRVQSALDKTNGYHFVYHNRVIKPALVGLTGPWISGGIEFNWPQHHRPSTYQPVDWTIEEHDDGSRTVWCSEIERMFRTRGRHGFTLHPDRAGFDIHVRLHNRTSEAQTFLWWANPAVHVNDTYQSVFPPDVHAVMDHGKRAVSDFPVATGVYYKQNYAPGTDISRYKNIPVPTSYMAYHSDYNFMGCYDHGPQAGMLHVANHHLVPGKKQWTWGDGDFGLAWDRQLTDEDGPYIELMCGAFTDNQPDFTWLMPGEEKRFTQTFMPYKSIGPACNASRDWALHMAHEDGRATMGVYAAKAGRCRVELWHNPGQPASFHNHKNMQLSTPTRPLASDAVRLFETELALETAGAWTHTVEVPPQLSGSEMTLRLVSEDGETVYLEYAPPSDEKPEVPSPATPAPQPASVASCEELFLHGQHLEQYRHATYAPEPYYEEALRRDAGDARCNNAMGLLLMRRGCFVEAEPYFRKAIERLTRRNPNPCDGEPYYQLGLCLRYQERFEEAFDAFYKAVWSEAWKSPAYFELARLAARAGRMEEALDLLEESLARNTRHQKAQHLRIALLRRTGAQEAALRRCEDVLRADPLDPGARHEGHLLAGDVAGGNAVEEPNRGYTLLELGLDYAHAGLYEEADALFEEASAREGMAVYYRGWIVLQRGDTESALDHFTQGQAQSMDFAFPNQLECVQALTRALSAQDRDAWAAYALGNFWYAHKQADKAIDCWEQCVEAQPDFATAWRNLGLAYMNKRHDPARAEAALLSAFENDDRDARVLYELDQFYKETGADPAARLARLDRYRALVAERDDISVEYAHLLNHAGRPADALDLLTTRVFHPWEGGEGKTTSEYLRALYLLAREAEESGDADQAVAWLEKAAEPFPVNLGEGRLTGSVDNELYYRLGCALRKAGRAQEAEEKLQAATQGISEPASAMYYNDQPPERIYFQGLAWRALGDEEKAQRLFRKLTNYADTHINDQIEMDYFAVSLPDFLVFDVDLTGRNRRHCLFMKLLGLTGLGQTPAAAIQELQTIVPDHVAFCILEE